MKNPKKRLIKLAVKAELCTQREVAQKLIRKADRAYAKLSHFSSDVPISSGLCSQEQTKEL
jgi:uncharacterized protein YijF (DUF1287 family)